MKKINIVFTLATLFFVSVLLAQEQKDSVIAQRSDTAMQQPLAPEKPQLPKVKEYGIGIYDLNGFSIQYRWGNEKRLYRVQGNIRGNSAIKPTGNNVNPNYTPLNLNFGLSFSILKIKSVSEKFGLMYGGVLGCAYNLNQSNQLTDNVINSKTKSESFQPYVGFALGGVYKINSSFLIYAEIDPNISYNYQQSKTTKTSNIGNTYNYINSFGLNGLSNSGASLTIVYRITK